MLKAQGAKLTAVLSFCLLSIIPVIERIINTRLKTICPLQLNEEIIPPQLHGRCLSVSIIPVR
jgi:hypothetical protein